MTTRKSQAFVLSALSAAALSATTPACLFAQSSGNRLLGIDISAWQGNLSTANWSTIRDTDHKSFVIIRSSRGGTTGYYDQSNSDNDPPTNTLSQRYDDPYFIQNITNATNAGLFAGTYHFGRMDIIEGTTNSGGIRNNGTDEANHFIEMAGPWMRPGYLLPMFDFEAGLNIRTSSELAQFAIDFSDRIYEVKGIRPSVYIGGNYANPMNNIAESAEMVAKLPTLVTARWPNQNDPNSIPVQTANPGDYTSNVYGPWDNAPNPAHPWAFWQYASTVRLQGISNGGANVDADVVHGGMEYLKDQLVPAIWMNDSSGSWTTMSNWNSGETPIAPVQGPGQVARVGPMTLPAVRLPGVNDTVILDRPNANITVTLDSGAHNIRKLIVREPLDITGGSSLTVNYVPVVPESTPNSAQFSKNVSLAVGASFSAHTTQVDAGNIFTLNGGTVTLNKINLVRDITPAKIVMGGDVAFNPLSNAAAVINSTGSGNNASIDLNGAQRSFDVSDGTSSIDLAVNVPIINGTIYKDGAGTLQLGATNTLTGGVTVNRGILLVTGSGQLGNSGVVTNMFVVTPGNGGSGYGGTLQLSGNVSYNLPIAIAGAGNTGVSLSAPGSTGALDNLSGTNTWAGTVTLNGTGGSGTDPLENQIGARAGTLVLSGVVQNGSSAATWVKTGAGDVVLTGASPNTYTGLTRLFGGRLIIEKNGALGGAGSASAASGNFFQNSLSASTLAFRAPGNSLGYSYTTWEVLNTEGLGNGGLGQIDNLGGVNTFAGAIALGGPTIAGIIQSNIGVSVGSLEVAGGLYARGSTSVRNITKTGVGTLVLSGTGATAATNNPIVIPLDGSSFTISAGTVDLRGAAPATKVLPSAMTWTVNSGATLQTTSGTFDPAGVSIFGGGSFVFAGGVTNIGALGVTGNATVAPGGAKTLRTNQLNILSNGKVDLADNDAIVNYTGSSPIGTWTGSNYTGLLGHIASGRNGGAWNAPAGLTTSQPDAAAGMTTLGVAEATQTLLITSTQTATWNGQSVDGTSVLVMYTYAGDANLDGKINVDDYTRIDSGLVAGVSGWANGDFNYDGKINIDDYTIIDISIANQGAPLNSGLGIGESVVAVPEPAMLGWLLGGLCLRRRRR